MDKQIYRLESSSDKKKWIHRASFMEGEPSRFGLPFNANVAVLEAKSFIDAWAHGYDRRTLKEIHDRKYVRIIIEI